MDGGADILKPGQEHDVHITFPGQPAAALQDVLIVVNQQDILRLKAAVLSLGHQGRGDQDAVFIGPHSEIAARGVGQPALPHVPGGDAHFLPDIRI